MKADSVIKNGLICTESGVIEGSIASKDGVIVAIGDDGSMPEAASVYDAKGLLILPGVVEPHCHLGLDKNEDGTAKGDPRFFEDMETESKAAVVGGVTTFNTTVVLTDPGGVPGKMGAVESAVDRAYCDVRYYVGVANDQEVADFNKYREKGILSTPKIFLGFRGKAAAVFGHPKEGYTNNFIYNAFKTFSAQGGPLNVMIHCEDAYLQEEFGPPAREMTPVSGNYLELFNQSSPGFLEAMDLCKVGYIGRNTNCPVYIVHISARETVAQLGVFKGQGYDITGETCLHYLLFATDDDIAFNNPDWNNQARVSPPIRRSSDREALWEAVRTGVITCVGTDHTNYSPWLNQLGGGPFWSAQPGCGDGMSLLMTGVFSEGVNKRRALDVPAFAKLMSENPAKALGIYPQKGALKPGSDMDVVVFDPDREWTFDSTKTYSTHAGSIYDGKQFKGKPVATFVRGRLVAEEGKVVVDKPVGKYVKNALTSFG